jgi:hypothetical protein
MFCREILDTIGATNYRTVERERDLEYLSTKRYNTL